LHLRGRFVRRHRQRGAVGIMLIIAATKNCSAGLGCGRRPGSALGADGNRVAAAQQNPDTLPVARLISTGNQCREGSRPARFGNDA